MFQSVCAFPERPEKQPGYMEEQVYVAEQMKITFLWQKQGKHFWLDMNITLANVLFLNMMAPYRHPPDSSESIQYQRLRYWRV